MGKNAEKVAYEEYGALVVGIVEANFATGLVLAFLGLGLLILTLAGGIGTLTGAKGGREIGK